MAPETYVLEPTELGTWLTLRQTGMADRTQLVGTAIGLETSFTRLVEIVRNGSVTAGRQRDPARYRREVVFEAAVTYRPTTDRPSSNARSFTLCSRSGSAARTADNSASAGRST